MRFLFFLLNLQDRKNVRQKRHVPIYRQQRNDQGEDTLKPDQDGLRKNQSHALTILTPMFQNSTFVTTCYMYANHLIHKNYFILKICHSFTTVRNA